PNGDVETEEWREEGLKLRREKQLGLSQTPVTAWVCRPGMTGGFLPPGGAKTFGVGELPPRGDDRGRAYPASPSPPREPGRRAALAALHGMRPKPVAEARVLELGCGDGANLIPMALGLPNARFVGVDLNAAAIDRGRELATALQLDNVDLQAADLSDWQPPNE